MGTGRSRFRRALETAIWRNAAEEEKLYLYRRDVEEIGKSVGLSAEEAAYQFLRLAGQSWVGWVWPENGPPIRVFAPPRSLDPNWTGAGWAIDEMQHMGTIPYSGLRWY